MHGLFLDVCCVDAGACFICRPGPPVSDDSLGLGQTCFTASLVLVRAMTRRAYTRHTLRNKKPILNSGSCPADSHSMKAQTEPPARHLFNSAPRRTGGVHDIWRPRPHSDQQERILTSWQRQKGGCDRDSDVHFAMHGDGANGPPAGPTLRKVRKPGPGARSYDGMVGLTWLGEWGHRRLRRCATAYW